jgi:transcriptional regulator with XRE-family HTH domain
MKMTNTKVLKCLIALSGYNITELAQKLNMSRATLSRKINGRSEFNSTEIMSLCDLIGVEDKDPIFFLKV